MRKIWWGLNVFWLVVFLTTLIYILTHQVALIGPVQSYPMKEFVFSIMFYFLSIIGVAQVLFYHFIRQREKHAQK